MFFKPEKKDCATPQSTLPVLQGSVLLIPATPASSNATVSLAGTVTSTAISRFVGP